MRLRDVLKDLAEQTRATYEQVLERQYPGHEARAQRVRNLRRRRFMEAMVGHTVVAAKCLKNGDIAIELDDGKVLVFLAQEGPVEVQHCASLAAAEEYAAATASSGKYLEEATQEDLERVAAVRGESIEALIGLP